MALGKKLRRLREQRDLPQETVARRAGLPHTYVARIERGEITSPRVETRRKLARVLGIPVAELLD
jgi:transcriptional regulator with XRE-family HTH domain